MLLASGRGDVQAAANFRRRSRAANEEVRQRPFRHRSSDRRYHHLGFVRSSASPQDDCWNRIGFKGDRSCGELPKVGIATTVPFSLPLASDCSRGRCPTCAAERGAGFERAEADSGPTAAVLVFRVGEEWLALDVRS